MHEYIRHNHINQSIFYRHNLFFFFLFFLSLIHSLSLQLPIFLLLSLFSKFFRLYMHVYEYTHVWSLFHSFYFSQHCIVFFFFLTFYSDIPKSFSPPLSLPPLSLSLSLSTHIHRCILKHKQFDKNNISPKVASSLTREYQLYPMVSQWPLSNHEQKGKSIFTYITFFLYQYFVY